MGYYVYISESNFRLPKDKFEEAYKRMCELNDHDELKTGGIFGNVQESYTGRYNPNKWFAWMPFNYPETCKSMIEILNELGFEDHQFNDDGDLIGFSYNNKIGSEGYFLKCLGGLMDENSYITWKGEEESDWYRYFYTKDDCLFQEAEVTYNWNLK